ncbi:MAG TPA: hypothetical protein PKE03_00475 [Bacteroidales bacterium]|nr:hypothetical protein [Bacteroidales bacterium]
MRVSLRAAFRIMLYVFVAQQVLTGCYKFEGDQTVPAYLRIDTIRFSTYYATQGSNTHNITDAWVYVNGQLIGAFELPATFPVLARGKQRLEIRPGIKLNGIAATRVPYPFMKPIVVEEFGFFEDSIVRINPQTTYYDNLRFAWKEDFEQISLTLEKTNQSDTSIFRTEPANHPDAWLSANSAHSGVIHLQGSRKLFRIMTFQGFNLPGDGSPIFLELDYKCDRAFGVGLLVRIDNTLETFPLVVVNKSQKWNKIYINLTPVVSAYNRAEYVKIYFESELGTDSEARYYFDNIKLIHRIQSQ